MKRFFGKIWDKLKTLFLLLKETGIQWNARDPFANSSIIAYYTIFSLPGLLVIIINIAGFFFGREAVTGELTSQIGGLTGSSNTAKDVENIIANATMSKGTTLASVLAVLTLIYGATGIFTQIQSILDKMWEVKPGEKRKWWLRLIVDRLFSFGLVLAVGFLLLVSLVLSTILSAFSTWVTDRLSDSFNFLFKIIDISMSVGIITLLFAAIYKFLPDAKVKWKYVWGGAFLTSVLFVAAKFALGYYFGKSNPGSTYGAAGSIVLIMLWVSYAGLILLFGAEFTKVYAKSLGEPVEPSEHAVSTAREPEKQLGDIGGAHP